MKISGRILAAAAAIAIACGAAGSTASAQSFPVCASGDLTIKNYSPDQIHLCLKMVDCYDINGQDGMGVTLAPGTEIPGVYGVANVTHQWTSPSPMPPMLWIQSQALPPTGNCYDIYFDEASCTILVYPSATPGPCLNP